MHYKAMEQGRRGGGSKDLLLPEADDIITTLMASYSFEYSRTASHLVTMFAWKNRTKRGFKYNLHTVTVVIDGVKQRMRVPTKVLRQLKKAGVTSHFQNLKKAE